MARPKAGRKGARKDNQPHSDAVSDIYKEMLREALSSSPPMETVKERPPKRRRTAGGATLTTRYEKTVEPSAAVTGNGASVEPGTRVDNPRPGREQTAYDESSDSIESDLDWEEVDLAQTAVQEDDSNQNGALDLVLGGNKPLKSPERMSRKRKPATTAERKLRLEIHKMHVLCLLAHVHLRNHWCNDEQVHQSLRKLLNKKNVQYLNPDAKLSQFQRTRSFVDGLKQAEEAFQLQFNVTARGMSRSYWAEDADGLADLPKDLDLPMEKADFREAAEKRSASRDVGAQLFCAVLRSVGVDARLVCSLQPLPFNGSVKGRTLPPAKPQVYIAVAPNDNAEESNASSDKEKITKQSNPGRAIGSLGGRSRFDSGPSLHHGSEHNSAVRPSGYVPMQPKRIVESPYPIYWVEAFDEAAQKWICVDPLVTRTIGKPSKIEPPTSDQGNNMSYVVAFEDDGTARDVTLRYAKAYNAKTRRSRVESTHQGVKWVKKVMRLYKRPHVLDRDQVENTEFARKEAQEGLPQSVQDFKDHPHYALERHLRRNEVIHPKRETGKMMTGRAGSAKGSEPIYRRCDVHIVRSADKWYRLGKEIKPGEQPLKRVAARRKQAPVAIVDMSDDGEDENADTALYANFQTIDYQPPPVVNGRIPRNVYGNLDIYVPSMVPPGGAHVLHPECARAARLLGVDYADAVTGFNFKGRHGTAIINGAVVAAEYATAIQEVIEGFADERAQEEEARRSLEALRMWRRFMAGLRIRERIEGYSVEGDVDAAQGMVPEDESMTHEAGGFFPTGEEENVAEPTASGFAPQSSNFSAGGGWLAEDTGTSQSVGPGMQEFVGSLSPPLDHPRKRLDEIHNTEALQDRSFVIPSIQVVYGKAAASSTNSEVESVLPGGFVTEDSPNIEGTPINGKIDDVAALTNLADQDLAQAILLQQAYESQQLVSEQERNSVPAKSWDSPDRVHIGSSAPTESASPLLDNTSGQVNTEQLPPSTISRANAQNGNSDDDQNSLLSEDPDDEDADPEWLA